LANRDSVEVKHYNKTRTVFFCFFLGKGREPRGANGFVDIAAPHGVDVDVDGGSAAEIGVGVSIV